MSWVHLDTAISLDVDRRATVQGLVDDASRKRGLVAIMQVDQFDYRKLKPFKQNKNFELTLSIHACSHADQAK